MADTTPPSDPPIDALLQERTRFQQWLAKLDAAAGNAPQSVRSKVRGDYEQRLQAVIDQLKSHAATIGEALERHRGSQTELAGRRAEAEEAMAEAEVRHAVGEYADEDWERLRSQTTTALESLRGELEKVGGEINRLVEVQGFITTPAVPEPAAEPQAEPEPEAIGESAHPKPPPAIEMLPDPTPDFAHASGTPSSVEPVPESAAGVNNAPRFVPKPVVEPARPRPAAPGAAKPVGTMDELAFLKSVGGDHGRATRRSGETGRPEVVATAAEPSAKPSQASHAKTLKCGECGTLNRPTEWYCERCGAELAAL